MPASRRSSDAGFFVAVGYGGYQVAHLFCQRVLVRCGDGRDPPVLESSLPLAVLSMSLLLAGAIIRDVDAQTIPSKPSCQECRVIVERVLTIGGLDERDAVDESPILARDARGRIFFVPTFERSNVKVFSNRGKFLRRLARQGAGAGEIMNANSIAVGPGDSIFVHDVRLNRINIYSPELKFVGSFNVPATSFLANGLTYLPDGTFLLNALIRTRDQSGQPLHIIDRNGKILRSFGSADGAFRGDFPYSIARQMAIDGRQRIWSVWVNQYLVERWSLNGNRDTAIRREASWFAEWWRTPKIETESTPPYTIFTSVQGADTIWVGVAVAAPDQARFREVTSGREGRSVTWSNQQKAFDTMVEVIDATSKHVVASGRLDQKLLAGLGSGYVAAFREDNEGVAFVDVLRLTLSVRSPSKPNTRRK